MIRLLRRALRSMRNGIYGDNIPVHEPIPSVFRRYNIIYIHVPKAAGSTVNDTFFGFGYGHRKIESYMNCDPDFTQQAFKFTFVRHPYTRFVSAYNYLNAGGKNDHDLQIRNAYPDALRSLQSFAEASEDQSFRQSIIHLHHQTDFLRLKAPNRYYLNMDYVGKLEFLDHHIDILCPLLPKDLETRLLSIKSKWLNVGRSPSPEIDRDVFDRIRRIYRVDYEVFGYDEWGTPELTTDLMTHQNQRLPFVHRRQ